MKTLSAICQTKTTFGWNEDVNSEKTTFIRTVFLSRSFIHPEEDRLKNQAAKTYCSQHRFYKIAHATSRILFKTGMETSMLVISWYKYHDFSEEVYEKFPKFSGLIALIFLKVHMFKVGAGLTEKPPRSE